jgi:hypothetical protein
MSFPRWIRSSFPGVEGGKQERLRAAAWVVAAPALLAACGGAGGGDTQVVRGRGYTFEAPAAWKLVRTPRALGAQGGDVELVQVTRLPLARAYTRDLFDRVVPELDRAANAVAAEVDGKVTSRTIEVLDERVRQYDLTFDGKLEQLTFVLRGKTNYQLLCRRDEDGDHDPCANLVRSFSIPG